ncbi:hypothetical protein KOR34_39150 [Posidoniimonas corsicana]|uniref:Lipoprotein n=1 Tax=Posidoniimonas corsicana TaxID=1938618 RepID=A0A5C5V875_9BACT|nr:hypothetical protein [Posidoniimonas corsicana]TWT34079.1 hypothetical protein KOR34_39150 [Posidoniimonas corsicana]
MDRFIRITALAVAGFTLVWMAGCGEPVDVQAVQQQKQQAAVDEQAEWEAKLAEGPTPIVPEDFVNVERKEDVNVVRGATSQAFLRSEGLIHLGNMQHQIDLQLLNDGRPKSNEDFHQLINEWGLPKPKLKEPYELYFDIDSAKVLKRPKPDASQAPEEASAQDSDAKLDSE